MAGEQQAQRLQNLAPVQRRLLLKLLQEEAARTAANRSIPSLEPRDSYPLSFAQQRLWFLHHLLPESPAYNLPVALRLQGALDLAALRRSFAEVVRRHAVLRARFVVEGEQPVQRIAPALHLLPLIDLQVIAGAALNGAVRRLSLDEARRPFDLAEGTPVRAALLQLAPGDHLLLVTLHHIVSDGWSNANLIREMVALYTAFAAGRPSPLAELPIQYVDFAVWQRQELAGERLETQLAYWRERLSGAPELLELPTDRPRPAVQGSRGAARQLVLGRELSGELERLSRESGATLFMTTLAAFLALLGGYSGQADLLVGSPIANRTRPELEPLIGFFANTLVLRVDLADDPGFRSLLHRVRESTLGAYEHQDLPFEKLVDELKLKRSLSHTPLVQVVFSLQRGPEAALDLSDLEIAPLPVEAHTSRFALTLDLVETPDGLCGRFEYDTDLFDASTIARLDQHFQILLTGIAARPERRLSDLPRLAPAERAQLLMEWNDTATGYPRQRMIPELFEDQVARSPHAAALTCGDLRLSYRDLDRRAGRLAQRLSALGVRCEERVGICAERSPELVVALLGVLKCGAAYLPLDPSYPAERLEFMARDAGVRVFLTQQRLVASLPSHGAAVCCLDAEGEGAAGEGPADPPSCRTSAENLAYVIYTSGSTGRPKGVMVQHRNVVNFFAGMDATIGCDPPGTWLAVTSISFDISVLELLWTLTRGFHVVLAASRDGIPELPAASSCAASHLQCTPSLARLLSLDAGALEVLRSLRKLLLGGEALPPALARRLRSVLPAEIYNLYGPTETTVWSACHRLEDCSGPMPIGRPLANTELYVLDPSLQPVPIGVPGEVFIGGDGVVRGYLGRPDLTAERFLPDPYSGRLGERLYRTSDLARYRPDGGLEFLGRCDLQVKVRGFRIELGEIESVLAQYPGVREAVVSVREEVPGERRLVAYLTCREEAPGSVELHEFLARRLPSYMVPAAFVRLDVLPLTPNGKVDRRALPAPDAVRPELASAFVAPRTPTERKLAEIWSALLGLEQVGVDDNFFALGGDSILSIQMSARANAVGLECTPRQLFQNQTIGKLAAALSACPVPQQTPAVEPDPPSASTAGVDPAMLESLAAGRQFEDVHPLSPLQRGLLFHALEEAASETYVFQSSCALEGELDAAGLERAWQRVMDRHTALRASFLWRTLDEPLQAVWPEARLPLAAHDWSDLPEGEQQARFEAYLLADRRRGFDLAAAPLMRLALIRLSAPRHRLVWSCHHLLLDGWSMGLVLGEVMAFYEASRRGEDLDLGLPQPYRAYIDWLRRQDLGPAEEFWRRRLQGFRGPSRLPSESAAGSRPAGEGGWRKRRRVLPRAATAELQSWARQHHLTLNTLVQGAWALLQSFRSGERDLVFGAVSSGRPADLPGVEHLVGNLANTLPVRVILPPVAPLASWLTELQAREFEARQFAYSPLAEVQKWSEVPRPLPLFESILGFQSQPAPRGLGVPERAPSLAIREVRQSLVVGYPLVLVVFPGPELALEIEFQPGRFRERAVDRLLRHLEWLLCRFTADPQVRLADLEAALSLADQQEKDEEEEKLQEIALQSLRNVRRRGAAGTRADQGL